MPRFNIVPTDLKFGRIEFVSSDASPIFRLIHSMQCGGDADVYKDGNYLASASLTECGFWTISNHLKSEKAHGGHVVSHAFSDR